MSTTTAERTRRRSRRATTALALALASILAAVQLFPLLWMLSGALRPTGDTGAGLVPADPTLENLAAVFDRIPFARYLFNSFATSVAVTVILVGLGAMAGYALARLRFRGREAIFAMFFATLLVALPVILVPLFVVTTWLGLGDSYAGLILPVAFTAFPVFLMRQFYIGFPKELEEASDLDGAGYLKRFWTVVLPLSRPMLASLGVITFLSTWNSFLWPLTVARDQRLWVVQVGIANFQNQYGGDWNLVMAASLLAAIPTLLLFLLLQRQIVESIKMSAFK